MEPTRKLKGGNMDIDLLPDSSASWKMDTCPWNDAEGTTEHKCAVKGISICKYFCGIGKPDIVLCEYPKD